ncbi:MAG: hypothetical protein R3B90_03040 [Planctomycetaceae bacterium]
MTAWLSDAEQRTPPTPAVPSGNAEERLNRLLNSMLSDPELLEALGDLFTERTQYEQAVRAYSQALDRSANRLVVHHKLGVALARTGEYELAFPSLSMAVGEAAAHYNLAIIMLERGDEAAGHSALHQALQIDPSLEPARRLKYQLSQRAAPAATMEPSGTGVNALELLMQVVNENRQTPQRSEWGVQISPVQSGLPPQANQMPQISPAGHGVQRADSREHPALNRQNGLK